jgi:hypothetical protein
VLEGRAVTGHKSDATFAYCAEKADRERMADAAIARVVGKAQEAKNGKP